MNTINFEIDNNINWDHVSYTSDFSYSTEQLKLYEDQLVKDQRFEEAIIIRDEILLRSINNDETTEGEYKSKILQLSPLIDYFKSLPKDPGTRTEVLSLSFKYKVKDLGLFDAIVHKVEFRGVEEFYHCTLSKRIGDKIIESRDEILSSSDMDENAMEKIQVLMHVPKKWDEVRDWDAWKFDVILKTENGKPEIIIID